MANRKDEVRSIVIVLTAGILSAIMIAAFFVLNFGPSGGYNLNAILLEPTLVDQLNFNDINPKIGTSDRYIFDKIVWTDDTGSDQQVNLKTYSTLYALLKNDKSLNDLELEKLFSHHMEPVSKLVIWIKTESPSSWQENEKIFQELEFQDDFYRVSLHEDSSLSPGVNWAYFSHPVIKETVQKNVSP